MKKKSVVFSTIGGVIGGFCGASSIHLSNTGILFYFGAPYFAFWCYI